jgi:phosphoglycolate phosphatase-like HAD superfamily hydrolase
VTDRLGVPGQEPVEVRPIEVARFVELFERDEQRRLRDDLRTVLSVHHEARVRLLGIATGRVRDDAVNSVQSVGVEETTEVAHDGVDVERGVPDTQSCLTGESPHRESILTRSAERNPLLLFVGVAEV